MSKTVDSKGDVAPQLTFTEEEHSDMVSFLNLMNEAKFEFSLQQAHKAANLHIKAVNITKKIYAHIMEVKRVTNKDGK